MFWDVHSHVVPSGDDGATSVAEGLELCRAARERGTSVLFATPHVWPHLGLSEKREATVRAVHAEMASELAGVGLDLRLGYELTPTVELLESDLRRFRLGDLAAVLMELPFAGPLGLAERLAEEIEGAGLVPVIAHPERADGVIDDPDVARDFAERGWLLQVNATSLLGYHGEEPEETAWLLVEDGLASLVGSDGHRAARPPFLNRAYEVVTERVGAVADGLFNGNALKALRDPAEAV